MRPPARPQARFQQTEQPLLLLLLRARAHDETNHATKHASMPCKAALTIRKGRTGRVKSYKQKSKRNNEKNEPPCAFCGEKILKGTGYRFKKAEGAPRKRRYHSDCWDTLVELLQSPSPCGFCDALVEGSEFKIRQARKYHNRCWEKLKTRHLAASARR